MALHFPFNMNDFDKALETHRLYNKQMKCDRIVRKINMSKKLDKMSKLSVVLVILAFFINMEIIIYGFYFMFIYMVINGAFSLYYFILSQRLDKKLTYDDFDNYEKHREAILKKEEREKNIKKLIDEK